MPAPTPAPAGAPQAAGPALHREDSSGSVPQVAVLPSGEMVYLSKDNPYARTYAENADPSAQHDSMGVGDDPYAIPLPHSLLATYQQPLVLERMGRIVRLLAMFDLVC